MHRRGASWVCLVLLLALPGGALAIETDQYYAWGRTLADSAEVLNAKTNLEISRVLDRVNAKKSGRNASCGKVRKEIVQHFRLLIFHDLELWANNTSLIERVPATPDEEREFRQEYLYHDYGGFDFVGLMPPSPTIQLAGVRMGTDKLTHFFSEGWWYYRWYSKGLRNGLTPEEAELKAIDHGIFTERTILGMGASGVLSIADLEANYAGMVYLRDLCEGDPPALERTDAGWQLRVSLDFRDWVTPRWDESYQSNIFSTRRWKRVRPILVRYCSILHSPEVRAQRQAYDERDRETPTGTRIRKLVEEGTLPDPREYSIEFNCRDEMPQGDP